MLDDSVEQLSPAALARLLDVDEGAHWSAADAAAALRQQLAAPLMPDLAVVPGARREYLAQLAGAMTLQEALTHASTDLLHAIKLWARHLREDAASPLCGGPATVIYYAVLAAGLKAGERLTTLSDGQLRQGFAWALQQAGAENLAPVLSAGLGTLGP